MCIPNFMICRKKSVYRSDHKSRYEKVKSSSLSGMREMAAYREEKERIWGAAFCGTLVFYGILFAEYLIPNNTNFGFDSAVM